MDLNAPLGMTPPHPRRWRRIVLLAGGSVCAAAVCGVALVIALADPRGGRPYAVAEVPPLLPSVPRPVALDTTPTGTVASPISTPSSTLSAAPLPVAPPIGGSARNGSLEAGVMVYRGGGAGAATTGSGPLVIDVTRAVDDPFGKSRGATSGVKSDAAALAQPAARPQPRQSRVAIFVSGMGLDAGATRTAIETMPAAVTLAFLPYGASVAADVGDAKSKGHEVVLQLPMRNKGGGNPGPHALRPGAPADVLKGDLAWLMDRFTGYDGVGNLLGAAVTADAAAMTQVLKIAGARHLYYLDDGTSLQSRATSLAPDLTVEAVKADLVLDATSDPAVVRANLDRLVAIAKRKGSAIGMASGVPEHLGTIARFAAELDGRGVVLVPVGAIAHGGIPQATATR